MCLCSWDQKKAAYDEIRHEKMHKLQQFEDYRYFVWRDGKDKAGHKPHGYELYYKD